jgi:hypothetical protein
MKQSLTCGCERGDNCTKTTVCALDSALQDQADEFKAGIQRIQNVLDDNRTSYIGRQIQSELYKLEKIG